METQLKLLEDSGWRLDDRTRDLGRRRVAEARAALRAAAERRHTGDQPESDRRRSRPAA